MFTYCRATLVAILVLPLIINCSKSTRTECPLRTPKADEEAELIALCLSGELVAPAYLYQRVLDDLKAIRTEFDDAFEAVHEIGFSPPWVPGNLMLGFDEAAFELFRDGQYHAWDDLNQPYQVTDMDTVPLTSGGVVLLVFRGRLHPCRLAELYENLPGVWAVSPNYIIGDWSNVYASQTLSGMSYLFRRGWGDCPSGCIYSEFWYFRVDDNWPMFVGHWVPHQEPNVPAWWEEAKVNRDHYCD
jgi:hypothetical protein